MTNFEETKALFEKLGLDFEVSTDGGYQDIILNADASDKHIVFTFKKGEYEYTA